MTSLARQRIEAAGKAFQNRGAVDARLAKERAMADRAAEAERIAREPLPPWRTIIKEVCERDGFTFNQILSDRRSVPLVRSRHEIWWRVTKETDLSLADIARRFNRDHTSIQHGVAAHERRMREAAR